jgi:hypothetical protein
MQEFTVGRDVEILWGSVSISYLELSVLSNAIFIIPALQEYTGAPRTYSPANEPAKFISRMCIAYGAPALSFVQSVCGQRMQHKQESLSTEGSFHVLISSLILDRDYNHPNCSDPRDTVFSLLGLANDGDFFDGIIDYSKNCEDTYEMTARKFLDQGHMISNHSVNFRKRLTRLPECQTGDDRQGDLARILIVRVRGPGISLLLEVVSHLSK